MSEIQRARQAVARLEMLSNGTVRNYTGDGRGGGTAALPAGGLKRYDLESFLSFRARLAGCRVEADWRQVADDCEAVVKGWLVSPDPSRDSVPWQEKAAKEPGSIRAAARVWNITPSYMHQLRTRFGKAA